MLRVQVALFLSLATLSLSDPYVPGTPGAPWTQEEMAIVKSKLFSMFYFFGGHHAILEIYNWGQLPDTFQPYVKPSAAKMLRLGFHDCLK